MKLNYIKLLVGQIFRCLIDELYDDKSSFIHIKNNILEAYKNDNLFGLRVNETDQMYERGALSDDIFCVKEDDKAIIIWTHTRARKNGFAKKIVQLLNIEYDFNPLPNS